MYVHSIRCMDIQMLEGKNLKYVSLCRKGPVFPLPAIHLRGSSADSTLTGSDAGNLLQQARAQGAAHARLQGCNSIDI